MHTMYRLNMVGFLSLLVSRHTRAPIQLNNNPPFPIRFTVENRHLQLGPGAWLVGQHPIQAFGTNAVMIAHIPASPSQKLEIRKGGASGNAALVVTQYV